MKKKILTVSLLIGFTFSAYAQGGESEPPYGMSHIEAYSLFYENYRTGDYEMALTFGEWMLEAKPREITGHRSFSLETQFRRLINVYEGFAEDESDPGEKSRLLEQALEIFDLTRETFTEDEIDLFEWTTRQGRFYQAHYNELDNGLDEAYRYYEMAYEMDLERFVESNDGYYARILLNNYVNRGEQEEALAFIDAVEPHAGSSLMETIEESRNELFDDPEERIGFLESRLDGGENEEETLQELADLYDQVGDRAQASETARRLYQLNPNFENTRTLADMALSNAEYNTALEYLKEAAEISDSDNQRKRILLEVSETYQNMDNLQSARDYARQAINLDSNYGAAYLRMSSIYAAAISSCTSGRSIDRDDRTVYWLVIDYLERAKEVDASTTNAANRRIESYRPVLPTSEDKFFRGWETGDSFTIDGSVRECYAWINESTTVQ